jgi:hypothetical protein
MIAFKEVTALLATALASWVASSASVVATVASTALAVPAAAPSERSVALLVAVFKESIAWPRRFWNVSDELPAAEPIAPAAPADAVPPIPEPAWAAPRDSIAPIEGIGGIAGIIFKP